MGTGKYPANSLIPEIIVRSGAEVITVALRRAGTRAAEENILNYIPPGFQLLPNTSGARNHQEAVRLARIAREVRSELTEA